MIDIEYALEKLYELLDEEKQGVLTAGTGITISDSTISKDSRIISTAVDIRNLDSFDFNNYTTSRVNRIYGNMKDSKVSNAPPDTISASTYYTLIVLPAYSTNRIQQILIWASPASYTPKIWYRHKLDSTTFTDWYVFGLTKAVAPSTLSKSAPLNDDAGGELL